MTTIAPKRIIISVDAMGGDRGPAAVVAGLALSADKNPDIGFILHGDEPKLKNLIAAKPILDGRVEIRHTDEVVTMDAKPSFVMRNGQNTSMWSTIDAVKAGEADVAVSCGNTGALMLLSMVRLRKLPGVNRPAIACLWPSRNPGGFNIMLDVGADIRADDTDLLQYAMMGASYARNGLGITRPRIGLLNVGTEEHKGHPVLKSAHELISDAADNANIEFVGFVEGVDIPSDRVDVIVTDGFTGNVALKTAEGTADLMAGFIRQSFTETLIAKLTAFIAKASLGRLKVRMDPRRANGGVFLGLNGTVVKSHGGADPLAISSAVKLAFTLSQSGFNQKLAARVASAGTPRQDGASKQSEQQE
ncbi:phosphate acyltransferase PlsX [Aliiroseovarius crassostreae]|uniref:phosphate acyltransferase PlsX n=1 Tax=Aliiroseovarius crassostreae TaxID=154981 RepID=UPI003C7D3BF1